MSSSTEATTPTTRKITLKTSDNEEFEVDESVAYEFATVKTYFEDFTSSNSMVIPLPNVGAKPLSYIIGFCKENLKIKEIPDEEAKKDKKKKFKEGFLKGKTDVDLLEMIPAANYLEIKDLLDVLNQEVADRIRNKSVEYVRAFFGIENDFTPEEEAKLRKENAWAFEGVDQD